MAAATMATEPSQQSHKNQTKCKDTARTGFAGECQDEKQPLKSTAQAPGHPNTPITYIYRLLYLCSRHKFKLTAVGKLGFYFTDTAGVERDARGVARSGGGGGGGNRIIFIL